MEIASSQMQLSAERRYTETYSRKESFRMMSGNVGEAPEDGSQAANLKTGVEDSMRDSMRDSVKLSSESLRASEIRESEQESTIVDLKLRILIAFVEKLTGKKVKMIDPSEFHSESEKPGPGGGAEASQASTPSQGFGFTYDLEERYEESESVSFQAAGLIRTADGRELTFDLNITMSRSFAETRSIHLEAGDIALIDPLVVNFDADSTRLSNRHFAFDLTLDGSPENIYFPDKGSGFLALDKNGDNVINDGRELFGPQTGNGFDELAKYDSDKNGWIDEKDSVFQDLKVWTKDEDGKDRLFALGALGIGAIYLGRVDTLFHLKGDDQVDRGQIASTGVFVRENGSVGTIQELDLAV